MVNNTNCEDLEKKKALIIDDEQIVLDSVTGYLQVRTMM